jgi:hypothetical protein
MITQRTLDEMVLKAREAAKSRVEQWQVVFLSDRHPDNFQSPTDEPAEPIQPELPQMGEVSA